MNERNLATRRVDLSPPSTVVDCLLIRNNNCSFVSSIHLLHTVNHIKKDHMVDAVEKAEKAEHAASDANAVLNNWFKLTIAAYCMHRFVGRKPAMVGTTATAIIAASTVLPKSITKIAHPLLLAAAATISSIVATAKASGLDVDATFHEYMNGGGILGGGAGDVRRENPLLLIYLSTHE
jgi:hypothetical protein